MKKWPFLLLILYSVPGISNSQEQDTLIFETCNTLYEENLFEEASECYRQYKDNIYAFFMVARIARELDDEESLEDYSKKLMKRKYRSPESYRLCARLYTEDSLKQLQILNKGLKHFKNDTLLLVELANYYLENYDFPMAIEIIDRILATDKANREYLYFARGFAFDAQGDMLNAIASYEEAIAENPFYFDPCFNAGVAYYNRAVDMFNDMVDIVDFDLYDRKLKEANATLEMAIPYFVKANEIDPEDITVLETLKSIFYRLGNQEKYQETLRRIEEIRGQ